ncbi:efflux transporter outer membrane subunit [Pokkaliibacter plantistimulans]|nr:efflux transporter outer membrane subunit [Pokkaliibacter plantistimulans]
MTILSTGSMSMSQRALSTVSSAVTGMARHNGRPLRLSALALSLTLLGGCVISEPRTQVAMALPAQWQEPDEAQGSVLEQQWWQGFHSAELDQLITQALAQSPDLHSTLEQVRQAELAVNVAGASLFPSVSASLGSDWRRSESSAGDSQQSRGSSGGLAISYEVDMWGRLAAARDSARASLAASRFDYQASRLSLASAVAEAYFNVLALDKQIGLAEDNLQIAARVMKIVDARFRNGMATALDVSQQRNTVLNQQAALLPLRVRARQTRSALAILLGQTPQTAMLTEHLALDALQPPAIRAGLPSELLTRRPDLASAEADLAAADADVLAARAALLPSVQLSSSLGVSTAALLSLANPANSVSLAGSLAQSLFDGGQRRSQVAISQSRRQQLVDNYRSAVLTALKEVEDALGNTRLTADQEQLQRQIVAESQRSLRLAELRYREGADELLAVLDAQRTLFSAQSSLVDIQLSRLTAALDLYKAVGGGWQQGQPIDTREPAGYPRLTTPAP